MKNILRKRAPSSPEKITGIMRNNISNAFKVYQVRNGHSYEELATNLTGLLKLTESYLISLQHRDKLFQALIKIIQPMSLNEELYGVSPDQSSQIGSPKSEAEQLITDVEVFTRFIHERTHATKEDFFNGDDEVIKRKFDSKFADFEAYDNLILWQHVITHLRKHESMLSGNTQSLPYLFKAYLLLHELKQLNLQFNNRMLATKSHPNDKKTHFELRLYLGVIGHLLHLLENELKYITARNNSENFASSEAPTANLILHTRSISDVLMTNLDPETINLNDDEYVSNIQKFCFEMLENNFPKTFKDTQPEHILDTITKISDETLRESSEWQLKNLLSAKRSLEHLSATVSSHMTLNLADNYLRTALIDTLIDKFSAMIGIYCFEQVRMQIEDAYYIKALDMAEKLNTALESDNDVGQKHFITHCYHFIESHLNEESDLAHHDSQKLKDFNRAHKDNCDPTVEGEIRLAREAQQRERIEQRNRAPSSSPIAISPS